jgi:hypothetical protein
MSGDSGIPVVRVTTTPAPPIEGMGGGFVDLKPAPTPSRWDRAWWASLQWIHGCLGTRTGKVDKCLI